MKYLIGSFCCFFLMPVIAQTIKYEGSISWNIVVEVKDLDAMGSYKKSILKEDNSEIEQTIKELEQQLNDPEMQYLLLENPTIKSTMQKKLRELKEIQEIKEEKFNNAFFPTSIQMYLKNNNSFSKIEGGSISKLIGNVLYLNDQKTSYFIKDETKTYSILSDSSVLNTSDKLVSLAKTTDTAIILNYTCIKYILVKEENNVIKTSNFWITTELPLMNPDAFRVLGFATGNLHHEAFKKVDGIPLRVEYVENGFKLKMEVNEVSSKILAENYFTIPMDYKITHLGF